jgi:3-hydroxyisobutyrate dehydrogenase
MGGPMAWHIHRCGKDVIVWNRSPERREPLRALGVPIADSLQDLAAQCGVVGICVNRTEDVRGCLDWMFETAKPGTLFVDHSTISPEGAVQMHADCKAKGFRFVDAPITGGSMGAQRGQLTIFMGGDEQDIAAAMPLVECYAKRAERVGGPGAGQMAKMANQIAVGGALLALCESLSFANKAGLDLAQIRDMVGSGAGGSWAFENYGPRLLTRDWSPGFSVKNQRKDFAYCKEAAREIDAAIPGTDLVDSLLAVLQEEGHEEWTTAALYDVMLRMGYGS